MPPAQLYTNQTPGPTPTAAPVPAGTYASAVIILLSDGENNESPDPLFRISQKNVLVAAFAGRERILRAYQNAIAHGYRFYSYGDCMLIR